MVEVDVFWAYGFGASLALGAGRQLKRAAKPFESRYFVWTVLFLALFWAPTGMLLLLRHPSWETMQAAGSFSAMSPFLVLAFGITNITQGVLGFWVGLKLIQRDHYYLANLNWLLGYFGMFFILVYGWDGLGYDRFFYDRDMLPGSPAWAPGAGTGGTLAGTAIAAWHLLTSGVALTLYTDGIYLLPPFAVLMYVWFRAGLRSEGQPLPGAATALALRLLGSYLLGVFVIALGSAIFCAAVVNYVGALLGVGNHVARGLGQVPAQTMAHVLSYLLGLPLGLGLLGFSVLRPGGLVQRGLGLWAAGDVAATGGREAAALATR